MYDYNEKAVREQLKIHDSFYLYDERIIKKHINELKEGFKNETIIYSVKNNPNTHVLDTVFSSGIGADAASLAEVYYAYDRGLPKDMIYFSCPGKTIKDIEESIDKAIIIADSINEIKIIQSIAGARNIHVNVGMRINPDFSFFGEGKGSPSKFGVDEDQAIAFIKDNSCSNITINGIHVHLHSQELSADILSGYHKKMFALARRIQDRSGAKLDYINFGSGLGITFAESNKPLDLSAVAASFEAERAEYIKDHPDTRFIIESGRYMSGKAGVYAAKVIDRKVSYGKNFIILKNTLNGFARPSVARMLAAVTGGEEPEIMYEPMYTGRSSFQFLPITDNTETETVTLVGCLCTGTDIIAQDIAMPHLEPGDGIVITNAGAYAAVMTPMQFASLEKPAELFLKEDGTVLS
mgnify:FL=1